MHGMSSFSARRLEKRNVKNDIPAVHHHGGEAYSVVDVVADHEGLAAGQRLIGIGVAAHHLRIHGRAQADQAVVEIVVGLSAQALRRHLRGHLVGAEDVVATLVLDEQHQAAVHGYINVAHLL